MEISTPAELAANSSQPKKNGRVLVFIVAYEAQRHTAALLDRVPKEMFNSDRVHFLMIDDASSDASAAEAEKWARDHDVRNLTVLRNPVNQRYGGNQKLGYRIGVEAGFDLIILLHGDGQYAPELLPKFIETWEQTNADVILGSRMQKVRDARAGGMPWYKVVGNRMLTIIQNGLTGRRLSEYHTGYRAYSIDFLRRVPFEINTNEFHFDTEILLQAFHIGAKIVEMPIPTHYGDEICRVNGVGYARDVVLATLQYKMHQMGMLCALKFRNLDITRYRDKRHVLYSSHELALRIVKNNSPKTILDIGCGPGFVAQRCGELGAEVTGIDAFEPLPGTVAKFYRMDLENDPLPVDAFAYDMILLLDVIEHLRDPEHFLVELRNRSESKARVKQPPLMVISTPNIAFAAIRLGLLLGRFNYAERGILDITHKRLFTRSSLKRALSDCGYDIEKVQGVGAPFGAVTSGRIGKLFGSMAAFLAWVWPTMFAFQFLVTCRPRPGVRQLLGQSERHLISSPDISQTLGDVPIGR